MYNYGSCCTSVYSKKVDSRFIRVHPWPDCFFFRIHMPPGHTVEKLSIWKFVSAFWSESHYFQSKVIDFNRGYGKESFSQSLRV